MGMLDKRVAIISGAGTGLGRATAEAFAHEGASVVLLGRRQCKLEDTAAWIGNPGRVMTAAADVAEEAAVAGAVAAALQRFGRIDILVNNAAIFEPGSVAEMSLREWNDQIAVNLTGPFLLTKAVLPIMRESRYGRIINVTSGLAWNGAGGYAAYSASKAGLESLTRTLADEEGRNGILVNAYNPGTIRSEMHATGKNPDMVVPDLLRLAALPTGGDTGTVFEYV